MRIRNQIKTFICFAGIPLAALNAAEIVDSKALLNPPADSWLTYHGEYNGQRHSKLTQINPQNVSELKQVWRFQATQQLKASPIVAGGVIYLTLPDNLWAIDARTGKELWHHVHTRNFAFHIGHRGAAIYKDTVFLTTPDCHLIALSTRNGEIKWDVLIADSGKGYWSTNAPLVIKNHVIVGVAGDFDNLPGLLRSFDADTGKPQWSFHSTPSRPDRTQERRCHWWPDVEHRHLRSGPQSDVRRNRKSDAGIKRRSASWRQSLDVQHRRPQSRYRKARVGFSGFAARHTRLGCC